MEKEREGGRERERELRRSFNQSSKSALLLMWVGFHIFNLISRNHLPKSSLLMLVSAFIGFEEMHQTYQHAISKEYRFFSYGDAMLLEKS